MANRSGRTGLADGLLAGAVPLFLSRLFTASAEVQLVMVSVVAYLALSLVLHANVVALEGVLFAAREANYLAKAYAASTLVFTTGMVLARAWSPTLVTVWAALLCYQVVRLVQFGCKVHTITVVRHGSDNAGST